MLLKLYMINVEMKDMYSFWMVLHRWWILVDCLYTCIWVDIYVFKIWP